MKGLIFSGFSPFLLNYSACCTCIREKVYFFFYAEGDNEKSNAGE